MPIKKRRECSKCRKAYDVVYYRSAYYQGIEIRDMAGNRLSEPFICKGCGKRLSLHDQGFNPLSLEK